MHLEVFTDFADLRYWLNRVAKFVALFRKLFFHCIGQLLIFKWQNHLVNILIYFMSLKNDVKETSKRCVLIIANLYS